MEWIICLLLFFNVVVNCQQLLPYVRLLGNTLPNNSYIYYANISDGGTSVSCVFNSSSDVGNWRDERGRPVHQGADGDTCLYVTGVISLHRRNSSCIPPTSGLWRCDVSHPSGEIESLYVYISNDTRYGELLLCITTAFTGLL